MRIASHEEQTLDLIYNAAVQPTLWVDVMQRLIDAVDGEVSVLTRMNVDTGEGVATPAQGDSSVVETYFAHYSSINPLQLVPDPTSYVEGWRPKILLDEDCLPRADLENSEYYNDFLSPLSADWNLAIRLGLSGLDLSAIGIARSFKHGRFEPWEIATAARLQPHLVRAYALSEKFVSLQDANASLTEALDRSSSATLLLDAEARILHANGVGERLLSQGDALRFADGRVSTVDPRSAPRLAAVIARAGSRDGEDRSAGSITLHGRGARPVTVTASPLRLEQTSVFERGSAVLVCVADPMAEAKPPKAQFEARFGLTGAEGRLAAALVEGSTVRQAADRHRISINTARVQLASIFAKTRTHSQIEMIRLMLSATTESGSRPQ